MLNFLFFLASPTDVCRRTEKIKIAALFFLCTVGQVGQISYCCDTNCDEIFEKWTNISQTFHTTIARCPDFDHRY